MKKFIQAIVIITFFIFPTICFSSYLIELKNGSEFITNHYWEEGLQIKFYHYGGIVGIIKDSVKAIRKSDITCKEEIDSKQDSVDPKSKTNGKSGITTTEKKEKHETVDVEYYKEKKSQLEARMKEALGRVREADKNKDSIGREIARKDAKKISEEMYALTAELTKKNNGKMPEEWWKK